MGSTDLGQLTAASSQGGHTDHLVANGRNGAGVADRNSPMPAAPMADDTVIHKVSGMQYSTILSTKRSTESYYMHRPIHANREAYSPYTKRKQIRRLNCATR